MSQVKFQAARELIREKRYAEARMLLESIDHPTAKLWLKKLDKLAPERKVNKNRKITVISVTLAVLIVAVLGIGISILRSPRGETIVAALPTLLELPTLIPTSTSTLTATYTETLPPTQTPTDTAVPTLTSTSTFTPTETFTPSATYTETSTSIPTATKTPAPTNTPRPTATPRPTESPTDSKMDGFYLVGVDIEYGRWESIGTSANCYWARLSSNGGINANHFGVAGGTITIRPGDVEVHFEGCGTLMYVENQVRFLEPTAFSTKDDGFYTIGVEIGVGRWRSIGVGGGCYWALLDQYQETIDNHFGDAGGSILISYDAYELEIHGCGPLEFVG